MDPIVITKELAHRIEVTEASCWTSYLNAVRGAGHHAEVNKFGSNRDVYALKSTAINSMLMNRVKNFTKDDIAQLGEIVDFYGETGTSFAFDMVPEFNGHELTGKLLDEYGARPLASYNLHIRRLDDLPPESEALEVRPATLDEYIDAFGPGLGLSPEKVQSAKEMSRTGWSAPELNKHVAIVGDEVVGTSMYYLGDDGIAVFGGATTLPDHRGTGVQSAGIRYRLHKVAEEGAEFAISDAVAGSTSSRNLQRHGFVIAYTRTYWGLRF